MGALVGWLGEEALVSVVVGACWAALVIAVREGAGSVSVGVDRESLPNNARKIAMDAAIAITIATSSTGVLGFWGDQKNPSVSSGAVERFGGGFGVGGFGVGGFGVGGFGVGGFGVGGFGGGGGGVGASWVVSVGDIPLWTMLVAAVRALAKVVQSG